jgi:hypothetical protein
LRLEHSKSNEIISKQIKHKEKLSLEIENLNLYISELQTSLKTGKAASYLNQSKIINFDHKYDLQLKRYTKLDTKNKLNLQQIDKLNQSNSKYKEELISMNKSLQLSLVSINQAAQDNIELTKRHDVEILKLNNKLKENDIVNSNNSVAFPVSPDINSNNINNDRENQSIVEEEMKSYSSKEKLIEMDVQNNSNKKYKIGFEDDEKSKFNGNLSYLKFASNLNTNLVSIFDKFSSDDINNFPNQKNKIYNEIITAECTKEGLNNEENKLNELNPETCCCCYEDAYGLMAICNSCKREFHSSCAKKQKKIMGKETELIFICINCNDS